MDSKINTINNLYTRPNYQEIRRINKRKTGIRIYNLFPRLVGKIPEWEIHVKRARSMGFNWIYINPINYTGFSGSLYSIKNFFQLNPMFAVDEKDQTSWKSFKTFVTKCHVWGIKVMLDLVINHVAIDSLLIEKHPDWFSYKWALIENVSGQVIKFFEEDETPTIDEYPPSEYHLEKKIANPYAIDPSDARKITIWGDLAQINYNSPKREEIVDYWKKLLDFYFKLGIDGFRCDAAYKIPSEIWNELIPYTKNKEPKILFLAETLGCTLSEMEAIARSNFDYIYNSSKYWDFTAPWCVEQYNKFRKFSPSISFPESHDTERLAKETNGREDIQRFRYFFASFFSAGVLMPIGYEFGFKRKLDVVDMQPDEWEQKLFDIQHFIAYVNQFKTQFELLQIDGPIEHCEYSDLNILVLKKNHLNGKAGMFLIYNKDWQSNHRVYIKDLSQNCLQNINFEIYKINIDLWGEKDFIQDLDVNTGNKLKKTFNLEKLENKKNSEDSKNSDNSDNIQITIDLELNPNQFVIYYWKERDRIKE